jgi:hypothetical protein
MFCYNILPLPLNVCRQDLRADNFDSIYKKYVQHLYLQINLLKIRFKYLPNDTTYVS